MGSWNDKVVVIAGGSRGLGLEIARKFHEFGSSIVILGRNADTIDAVVDQLNERRADSIWGISVDLTDDRQRDDAIHQILSRQSKIDVWVNAVGQSTRTDFLDTRIDQYRLLMDQNFFVSLGCSLAVLPSLKTSSGHLINIGSLASRTAWPFLAPYVTGKHALAGFAHQLRIEGPGNIHYLFVCPGPIQSSESADRYQSESAGLPQKARERGAGAPVKAIDASWLADKIVTACEKRKPELVVPWKSRMLFSVQQLWPSLGDKIIRRFCR